MERWLLISLQFTCLQSISKQKLLHVARRLFTSPLSNRGLPASQKIQRDEKYTNIFEVLEAMCTNPKLLFSLADPESRVLLYKSKTQNWKMSLLRQTFIALLLVKE